MRDGKNNWPKRNVLWEPRDGRSEKLQRVKYVYCVESEKRRRWKWLEEQLARPFPLQWLPLEWTEHEEKEEDKEEDTVQTILANALESMDQYL